MEEAVAVPQEPLPELQVLPTEPSGCSFWSGTEMAFAFSYTSLHVCVCVSVCTPRAFQVPFGVLEASEYVHCTPKFSFCLPLHPGAFPGPCSTSGNSWKISVSPELSKHPFLLPGALHRCF